MTTIKNALLSALYAALCLALGLVILAVVFSVAIIATPFAAVNEGVKYYNLRQGTSNE